MWRAMKCGTFSLDVEDEKSLRMVGEKTNGIGWTTVNILS
jgi:hypothetical protein